MTYYPLNLLTNRSCAFAYDDKGNGLPCAGWIIFGSNDIKFKALSTSFGESAVNREVLALGQPKSLINVSPDKRSPVSVLNKAKLPGVCPGAATTRQVEPKSRCPASSD